MGTLSAFLFAGLLAVAGGSVFDSGLVGDAGRLLPSGHGPGGATGAQLLGEAAVVLTALALFASWLGEHGPRPRPVALALLPAISLGAARKINWALTGITDGSAVGGLPDMPGRRRHRRAEGAAA